MEQGLSPEGAERKESIVEQGRRIFVDTILRSMAMPEQFLGNGSVGEVFRIAGTDHVCAKIVHNIARYQEGNTVHTEGHIQGSLQDLVVEEVRCPFFFESMMTEAGIFLIMEELDAVCLRRVMEGHDQMPNAFDAADYFKRLKAYIKAMHKLGIYHLDLSPRNLMVDRQTGHPYVIDFGKSQTKLDIMGERFDVLSTSYENRDIAGFDASRAEVTNWQTTHRKHNT